MALSTENSEQQVRKVLDRVREAKNRLTKTEQRLAELLVGQPESFALGTVSAVAKQAGVSDATVIRFCYNLGYGGFSALKEHIQDTTFRQWTVKQ